MSRISNFYWESLCSISLPLTNISLFCEVKDISRSYGILSKSTSYISIEFLFKTLTLPKEKDVMSSEKYKELKFLFFNLILSFVMSKFLS